MINLWGLLELLASLDPRPTCPLCSARCAKTVAACPACGTKVVAVKTVDGRCKLVAAEGVDLGQRVEEARRMLNASNSAPTLKQETDALNIKLKKIEADREELLKRL